MLWVFIDEHPASINDGGFGLRMPDNPAGTSGQGWADYPAGFHADVGSLAFMDGHAELHKWRESTSLGATGLGARVTALPQVHRGNIPNNRDLLWLAQRTSALKDGSNPY
jgi:hypothetical protein